MASLLFQCSVIVALISAVLVILERQLPLPKEQGFHEELLGLPPHLQDWYKRGKRLLVSPKDNMSLFSIAEGKGPETLLLLHAMPSSSHDYHRVLPLITEEFRVVVFDLPGFGFSDKPKQNYTYSVPNQVEMILSLVKELDLDSAHVVAYGMSVPLVEEILARRDRGVLPERFNTFFKSVTFSHSGMILDLYKPMTAHAAILTTFGPWINSLASKLPQTLVDYISLTLPMKTMWSPTSRNTVQRDMEIQDIVSLHAFQNPGKALRSQLVLTQLARPLNEQRWLWALSRLDLPVLLLWGDCDPVAPAEIPKMLVADHLRKVEVTLNIMEGVGHFPMLEDPEGWSQLVTAFVKSVSSKAQNVELQLQSN